MNAVQVLPTTVCSANIFTPLQGRVETDDTGSSGNDTGSSGSNAL